MSDENDTQKSPRSKLAISSEDFVRFLEEKTLGSECPACGTDEWTIVCPPDPDGLSDTYRLVTPLRDGGKSMNISTFAIFCDHCGFVRQHLSRSVRQWVAENPVNPELDLEPQLGPIDERE